MQTTTANEIHDDNRLSPDLPVDEATRHEIRRRYPASAFKGPLFDGRDRIALAMATVMLPDSGGGSRGGLCDRYCQPRRR